MALITNHPQAATNRDAGLVNLRQLEAGTLCLLLGVLVYVFARPDGVLFLPQSLSLGRLVPPFVHDLSGPLPVFFHVLGLSLLSSAVLAPGRFTAFGVCLSWAVVNAGFEIGQHIAVYGWLESRLPVPLLETWPLEQILRYLHQGTFDPADLAACLPAAVVAYLFISRNPCAEEGDHEPG